MEPTCKNKLSNFPFLTGCTNSNFVIPVLYYNGTNYQNYNITFQDFACGVFDNYVSGATLNGYDLILTRTDGTNMTINLFDIDTFLSAGTYSNGFIYFSGHNTNFAIDVTALLDDTNTYVTGSTLDGSILTLTRNDGVQISTDLTPLLFTGNTSGSCISDLYVHNLGGCSPIILQTSFRSSVAIDSNDTSFALGYNSIATGNTSFAFGYNTRAEGNYSHAEGRNTTASGYAAHVEGFNTTASGNYSHAEGQNTIASGTTSHAEGIGNVSSGEASHTEGGTSENLGDIYYTPNIASGTGAHAEGADNIASGICSHVEGGGLDKYLNEPGGNEASGYASHAEGGNTVAAGIYSHTEGWKSVAGGNNGSHAEGAGAAAGLKMFTIASIVNGLITIANVDDLTSEFINAPHLYVYGTNGLNLYRIDNMFVSGSDFKIQLIDTTVNVGSYTCGKRKLASSLADATIGNTTHAEGSYTFAIGNYSHAEGGNTIASGDNSHAEGGVTNASGIYSHAEGQNTIANGSRSHAEGKYNYAGGLTSHVEGSLSVAGLSIYDKITSGSGSDTITVSGDKTGTYTAGLNVITISTSSGYESLLTNSVNSSSYDGGSDTTTIILNTASAYNDNKIFNTVTNVTPYSHAEGYASIAGGVGSHAEGSNTTASGNYSHAEGVGTTASGYGTHAEGLGTTASGNYSHAEGSITIASGLNSHVGGQSYQIGNEVIASGISSFNHSTTTAGNTSYALGNYSAILGGVNNNVYGERSVVLGGTGITGLSGDTVYVPKIEIIETTNQIVMVDAVTGLRNSIVLSGGTFVITEL